MSAPSQTVDLAVVLVHYHTPRLLARAVAGFRAELAELGVGDPGRVIVVDNGSRPEDREELRRLGTRWIDPGENLGYAGGINRGVAATEAQRLVIANPDLELHGCLSPLLEEVERGADVAGPAFYWDGQLRWKMPPAQRRDRTSALLDALAERSPRWRRAARRRWRRHAHRHWQSERSLSSFALSGALLAFTRSAWNVVGPFDAGYRLYFEETDWLERARRAGLVARYVPSARVVHAHARSTSREPRAAQWFEASARRFRRRRYGRVFAAMLERLARGEGGEGRGPGSERASSDRRLRPGQKIDLAALHAGPDAWLEVSPRELGYPAIGRGLESPPRPWKVEEELVSGLGSPLRVAVVDERDIERAVWRLEGDQNRSPSAIE